MDTQKGIIDEELYFVLTYAVQLTGEAEKLYKWAIKLLNQLNQNSQRFMYLNACTTYLVREYLPEKQAEFSERLSKLSSNESFFKKMTALLSEGVA